MTVWRRWGCGAGLFGLLLVGCSPPAPPDGPKVQGWTWQERRDWYEATQGSRLIPLAWLRALDQPGSDQPFLEASYIAGFRYMPSEPASGLPLGFAIDDRNDGDLTLTRLRWKSGQGEREQWVGMNCAACHTGHVRLAGRAIRIEGGQSLADFQGFMEGLNQAMTQAGQDPARFDRFAGRVLGAQDDAGNRALLRRAMTEWMGWQDRQLRANAVPLRYGYGRVDAFGHIFNKVAQIASPVAPGNPADAPVSYPFLWQITRLPFVQYNAIVSNGPNVGRGASTLDIGAAGRNAGEVIGVFADLSMAPVGSTGGLVSSVQLSSQVALEQQLMRLEAPRWPKDLPVDRVLAQRGAALYQQQCVSCHVMSSQVVDGYFPARISTFLDASKTAATKDPTPNRAPGTDPWMACNAAMRTSSTGTLRGRPQSVLLGERFGETAPVANMLRYSVVGALLGQGLVSDGSLILQSWLGQPQRPVVVRPRPGVAAGVAPRALRPAEDAERQARLEACMNTVDPLLGYKSRPLDGVWATAPFLHNGSVPNLYELLLPAAQRSGSFPLGTLEYDPVRLGYSTDPAAPGNSFVFRTRDAAGRPIPGNDNAGHDYGNAALTEADRMAILEYLKTL